MWDVEYTDEFELWWESLTEAEQIDVAAVVDLLAERGTNLRFPFTSGIEGSTLSHMRELVYNMQATLIGYCMLSIPGVVLSYYWVATRQGISGGMKKMSLLQRNSIRRI